MDWAGLSRDYGAILAAGVALILGVYGKRLERFVSRPELQFGLTNGPPDCHMTIATVRLQIRDTLVTRQARCYYIRVRVHNFGKSSAEDVEVVITGVERLEADGEFRPWGAFLPLNVVWAHTQEIAAKRIAPGGDVPRYCDLAHVVDPAHRELFGLAHPRLATPADRAVLALDVSVAPNTGTHLLEPGTYILNLAMTASNAGTVRRRVRLQFSGDWSDDEATMRDHASVALMA